MASQEQLRAQWQEYFDEQLASIGERAPAPIAGQSSNAYVQRTCRRIQNELPQNHALAQVDFNELRGDALSVMAPKLVEARRVEAINPANFDPDEIRLVPWTDPQTGRKENRFYGQHSFVKDMTRPGRRVVSFTTSNGRYDAVKARYF